MSDRLSTKLKKLALLLAADAFLAAIAAHLAPSLTAGGESPLPLGLLLFLFAGLFVIAAVFLIDMVFQDKGKIQEFLETVRLPATVMDGEGRLIFTNQKMKHLLGNSVGRLAAIVSSGNAAVYDFFDARAIIDLEDRYYNVEEHVMSPESGFPPPHRLVVLHDITRLFQLRAGLREVSGILSQIGDNSSRLSTSSASLTQGVSAQTASLVAITKGMDEFSKKIQGNTESASKGSQLAAQAKEAAERSGSEITNALSAMTDVQDAGVRIARIVKLIDDIAFQTNLLALNAAVEAARAGRQGKGFAVVADEVRNLAGRSAKAAKDTASMVEDVTERIGNATAYISKLKEILGNIVQDAIRMADSSANTSAISSEQATGILSVNRELNQLNTATNSTISAAQQSSSAVVTLSQHISNLRERLAQIVNSAFVEDGRGPSPSMARPFDPVINLSDSQVFRGSESDQVDFSGFKRAGPTSSDYLRGEDKIGDFRFLPPNSADSDWRGPSEDGARGYRPPRDSDQYGLTPFDSGTGEVRTAEGDRLVKPSQNITLDDAEFGRY
jgi:hypothetical protein